MREIKFRAWNGKELFNVDVMAISECAWDCPDYGKRGVSLAYQPHIQVMQYTGLKDKNGHDIYEGDIVCCFTTTYSVVVQKQYAYGLDTKGIGFKPFYEVYGECEILGNIYENPELLEETK